MASQLFFVGKTFLGERTIPDVRAVPGLDARLHHSHAYFCPFCGDIWGRVIHTKGGYTQCSQRPCRAHGDGRLGTLPYSFLGDATNFDEDWPAAAIKWEFETELLYAERRLNLGLAT